MAVAVSGALDCYPPTSHVLVDVETVFAIVSSSKHQNRIGAAGPGINVNQPDALLHRRNVDVKDKVCVREAVTQLCAEKVGDAVAKVRTQLEQKVVVVEVALTDADERAVAHKAAKLDRRVHLDKLAENEEVRNPVRA